ncbi:PREDICTED: uncharacterized protein LOC104593512 isoform X2 [Nelumbo nucifera]|uniref:Uncharacterized protein LOC104593512 isoform X2 n=1 Tax=Nelumbo nucifera TaxID=4432 RepID=A0A1U7ZS89_NELNU|nr:PREDICTED: uncharacterized protein LOC104593512 isoform X2 [Nelumbo nucifera]
MDAGVKRDLVRASHSGDWEAAVQIFDRYPDALTSWINEYSETSLHIAANVGHTQFVLNLTRRLASHDIAKTDWSNHVALHGAAAADCTEIARAMMERNETLTGFINYRGETPLIKAFQCAGKEMVDFLYQSDKAKDPCPFERENIGVRTLTNAIYSGYFDEALYLVDNFPHLLVGFDEKDNTALLALAKKPSVFKSSSRLGFLEGIIYSCIHLEQAHDRTPNGTTQNAIGSNTQNPTTGTSAMPNLVRFLQKALINRVAIIKRVYNKKLMHKQSVELVKRICEQLEDISAQIEDGRIENMEAPFYQVRGAMHLAAENGIEELIIECLNHFPGQVWYVLDDQHCRYHKRASYQGTPFHTAIVYRQEKIFNLIHRTGGFKKMLSFYGSNMLHLVAKLAPSSRINCVSGAALQMQRELQWFKEIEKFVSPHCKEETNNEGKTPRAAFGEEHMDLVEKGEKWMKDTATSCMIVATLIATVVFAAAFTVPGGNIDGFLFHMEFL